MATLQVKKSTKLATLTMEGPWPTAIAFLEKDKLVVGNRGGQMFLWNLPEKPTTEETAPSRQLKGHTNGITHLRATKDGKTLVSSSLDRSIRIWNPDAKATGQAEVILDIEQRKRDSKRKRKPEILTAPGVKVETIAAAHTLAERGDWIQALGMSADEKRIISGDDKGQVIVHDLANQGRINGWSVKLWVIAADLSPDGRTAVVSENRRRAGDFDRAVPALKLWDVATGKVKKDLYPTEKKSRTVYRKFFANGLIAARFSPDGKILAVGQGGETGTGKVHLFDVESGKLLRSVSGHRYGVTDLLFSADSKYVISTGRDTMVRITSVSDGKEAAQLGKQRGGQFKDWFYSVALSPDQTRLAATDIAGKVHIWQMGS